MKRYLVRTQSESGAIRDFGQFKTKAEAGFAAARLAVGNISAFVLDLETPVGRGFKIVTQITKQR